MQEEIMKELLKYAEDKMNNKNAYPFCAFIIREQEIISKGYNDEVILSGDRTQHGEVVAIRKAYESLKIYSSSPLGKEYEIYTTCEPCLACIDTCIWAGIRKFVTCVDHEDFPEYFNNNSYNLDNLSKDNPSNINVIKKVLNKDGKELFMKAKAKYGW